MKKVDCSLELRHSGKKLTLTIELKNEPEKKLWPILLFLGTVDGIEIIGKEIFGLRGSLSEMVGVLKEKVGYDHCENTPTHRPPVDPSIVSH